MFLIGKIGVTSLNYSVDEYIIQYYNTKVIACYIAIKDVDCNIVILGCYFFSEIFVKVYDLSVIIKKKYIS